MSQKFSGLATTIYEVVSGQILLSSRETFYDLHSNMLLPMMEEAGIKPFLLLVTEIGRYGRFLDIYQYNSLEEYQRLTDSLLRNEGMKKYYDLISKCVLGSIEVEIMQTLPYNEKWSNNNSY